MGILNSIGRWFKTWGYRLTGRIDSTTDTMLEDPHVIRATFDEVDLRSKQNVQQFMDAAAGVLTMREEKIARVKTLTEEVEKLERLRKGAAAKIKARFEELRAKGLSEEEMKHDEEYLKCRGAYSDFGTTAEEKRKLIVELNGQIIEANAKIKKHKIQLDAMKRKIHALREKKDDLITRVITAKEDKRISDLESGLSVDTGVYDIVNRLEQRVRRTEAAAKISSELSGTDTQVQEAEFEEYARSGLANDEFDALVGLGDRPISAPETPEQERRAAELDKELQ